MWKFTETKDGGFVIEGNCDDYIEMRDVACEQQLAFSYMLTEAIRIGVDVLVGQYKRKGK